MQNIIKKRHYAFIIYNQTFRTIISFYKREISIKRHSHQLSTQFVEHKTTGPKSPNCHGHKSLVQSMSTCTNLKSTFLRQSTMTMPQWTKHWNPIWSHVRIEHQKTPFSAALHFNNTNAEKEKTNKLDTSWVSKAEGEKIHNQDDKPSKTTSCRRLKYLRSKIIMADNIESNSKRRRRQRRMHESKLI